MSDKEEELKSDDKSPDVANECLNESDLNSTKDSDLSPTKKNLRKGRYGKKKCKNLPERVTRSTTHHATINKNKPGRKRAQSFPAVSKFFLPHKRPRKDVFIPPTKFLLGGNISDPLNLNSLQDEDVNRAMNAVTPKSSPLPTPPRYKSKIEVIIPPNIRDPLNLMEPLDNDEYEKQLESVQAKKTRKRTKSRRKTSESIEPAVEPPKDPVKVETPKNAEPEVVKDSTPVKAELKLDLPVQRGLKRTNSESDGTKPKEGAKKLRRMDSLDKIVSPVVPQPGAWKRHSRGGGAGPGGGPTRGGHHAAAKSAPGTAKVSATPVKEQTVEKALPKFHAKNTRYQYGNYDRYYGYRNLNAQMDVRLKVFEMHRHLFQNKDVLDIGCNVGHIAISIAQKLGARSVTGVDIDHQLIARARRNLQNYVTVPTDPSCELDKSGEDKKTDMSGMSEGSAQVYDGSFGKGDDKCKEEDEKKDMELSNAKFKQARRPKKNRKAFGKQIDTSNYYFPMSFTLMYGPISSAPSTSQANEPKLFPHNVTFKQANYILKDESLLNAETPQYDLILCLSTTKWFHLNHGDQGVKMAFKRMFAELRPGGKLILEPQNWASYKKKKRLTETIYKNYNSIEFFPEKFSEFLLSPEVGFSKKTVLGVPQHLSKGFRRPIQLFIKGDFTPSKAPWSDTHAPSSHHRTEVDAQQRQPVYAATLSPYRPWSDYTPSHGAATPYSPLTQPAVQHTKRVYAAAPSPIGDASPYYVSPAGDNSPHTLPSYSTSGVYASVASPHGDLSPRRNLPSYTSSTKVSPMGDISPAGDLSPRFPSYTSSRVYATIASPRGDISPRGDMSPRLPSYTSSCGWGESPSYSLSPRGDASPVGGNSPRMPSYSTSAYTSEQSPRGDTWPYIVSPRGDASPVGEKSPRPPSYTVPAGLVSPGGDTSPRAAEPAPSPNSNEEPSL